MPSLTVARPYGGRMVVVLSVGRMVVVLSVDRMAGRPTARRAALIMAGATDHITRAPGWRQAWRLAPLRGAAASYPPPPYYAPSPVAACGYYPYPPC
jgi:hypothetical protein